MQSRKLILFGAITLLALGAAITATKLRAPAQQAEKPLLFPDLRARANDVGEIQIQGQDRTITLARQGDLWTIREADGYPALIDRVRDAVIGVAELRQLSVKTSNTKMFKRLGVEDIKESGSNSVLLQVKDTKGAHMVSLIVGRVRRATSRAESPALYVRLPDAANALLVEGSVEVSTDPGRWFNRDLFDITPDRVQSLEITHADGGKVKMARAIKGADLILADVPPGKEAQSSVITSRMGTVLETFSMEGARAAANVTLPADAATMSVRTFDGIVATLISGRVDDKPMTRISFAYEAPANTEAEKPKAAEAPVDQPAIETPAPDPITAVSDSAETPPDIQGQVEKYNAAVKDWVFQVPQFRFELLTRRTADLVRDPLPKGASPIKLPE